MYLVRLPSRSGLKIALAVEADVRAEHPEIHRPAKRQGAWGTLVEGTGKRRKDAIDLRLGRESSEGERGGPPVQRHVRVQLADVSATVRRLPGEVAKRLQENAEQIARQEEKLRWLKDERAELVREGWRKSRKSVGARELEQAVQRTASIAEVPARALALTPEQRAALTRDQQTLNAFARKVLGG